MRNIVLTTHHRSKYLKVEVSGGVISIRTGLEDDNQRPVTVVEVLADGKRYPGFPPSWINGKVGCEGSSVQIVTMGEAE